MRKINSTIEGILDELQDSFLDVDKQQKRVIESIKMRNAKFEEEEQIPEIEGIEGIDLTSSSSRLKKEAIIGGLNNDAFKIINDTQKVRTELIKLYAKVIMERKGEEGVPKDTNEKPLNIKAIQEELNKLKKDK